MCTKGVLYGSRPSPLSETARLVKSHLKCEMSLTGMIVFHINTHKRAGPIQSSKDAAESYFEQLPNKVTTVSPLFRSRSNYKIAPARGEVFSCEHKSNSSRSSRRLSELSTHTSPSRPCLFLLIAITNIFDYLIIIRYNGSWICEIRVFHRVSHK